VQKAILINIFLSLSNGFECLNANLILLGNVVSRLKVCAKQIRRFKQQTNLKRTIQ